MLIVVATEAERPRRIRAEVLVSGVGKTAAGAATAARLARGGASAVVSFGAAGAYPRSGLSIGDVVVASEVAVLDEGLDEGDRFVPFDRPGMTVPGARWAAADEGLLARLRTGADAGFRVVAGRIATVSAGAGTERLAVARQESGALAEGMEGAAAAYAASLFAVPFVEVRGISNLCGPRSGRPFDLARAVRNAQTVLARLEA